MNFPERLTADQNTTIKYVIRTVIPGKMQAAGTNESYGIVPKMKNTGCYSSQPFDILEVRYVHIFKLPLKPYFYLNFY